MTESTYPTDVSATMSFGGMFWRFRTGSRRERSDGLNRGSLPYPPALKEPGTSWSALALKCPTGRHLRAATWTRATTVYKMLSSFSPFS
jgi:hypothetical protein